MIVCRNCLRVNLVGSLQLTQDPWKEAKIVYWAVIFHAIIIEEGFLQQWGDKGRLEVRSKGTLSEQ